MNDTHHPPGSVYYSDEFVTLYHGDCREITEWLSADVLVTDPPYGRAWKQGDLHGDKHAGIAGDADTTTRDEALALWGERPVIAFGDLMLTPPPGTKQVLVYAKPVDAGTRGAMAGFRRDAEAVYLIGKWPSGIGGQSSVLRTAARMVGGSVGLATRGEHPHSKPLDVMERLLRLTDGIIADPFAGSGSTLLTARNIGRKAIGVELEERYCEVIAKRLSQGVLDFGAVS
jgi:DNA modification methylase